MKTWRTTVVLSAAALALPLVALPSVANAHGEKVYTCRGEVAVVADQAYWSGSERRDVVVASASIVDTLNSLGSDDLICLYGDPDSAYHGIVVNAGDGHDTVITYGGSNDIYGEGGNDIVFLNGLEERVEGGTGNDHVWGLGAGRVFLYGDGGTDILQGSHANDTLRGGPDGDIVIGAGGNDSIDGESGDDALQGGAGDDTITGGAGEDSCSDTSDTAFNTCEVVAYTPPFPIGS